ncbi:hypothetical protein HY483_00490 [Candidatus Woesearchaeota archaeon]|nr:hypothetical protein [Candidatus Woesearchaeota archaeon]
MNFSNFSAARFMSSKRGDVADAVVWIGRFIVVIAAITFLAMIASRLTNVTHDTLDLDARLQETQVFIALSLSNNNTGVDELGVLSEKKIVDIGESDSLDWDFARPQEYTVRIFSESGSDVIAQWYVNKLDYNEAQPFLRVEGDGGAREVSHNYYALFQRADNIVPTPVILEVKTVEK